MYYHDFTGLYREKLQELESALREKHEELAQSAVKSEKIETDLVKVKEIVVANEENHSAALQQVKIVRRSVLLSVRLPVRPCARSHVKSHPAILRSSNPIPYTYILRAR